MFGRVSRRARDNDHAPTRALTPHAANGPFAKIQRAHEIHVDDGSRRFEQAALLVKRVVKVVFVFIDTGIGDCDVDFAYVLEGCTKVVPGGLIALDEFDARG